MKEDLIKKILDNWNMILEEYNGVTKTIPLRNFDEVPSYTPEWRAITLWWNYKPLPPFQKQMPKTTELVREGPSHRATGWLLLQPHSKTPEHNHLDWGHKIIVHIPTEVPEGDVGFSVDGKIHRWEVGKPFAFDCYQTHYGFNNTDKLRSIMVLDFDYDEYIDMLKPYMTLTNFESN
jgi:aspartyl/asparaginyl beta-hydroxylase (cupin superfamily)